MSTATINHDDYFARVLPLLGEGLSRYTIEVKGLGLAQRVVELLVSCRLQRIITHEPLDLLRGFLTWKNPHLPLELAEGKADCVIDARSTEGAPFIVWREEQVTIGVPDSLFLHQQITYTAARQIKDWLLSGEPPPRGVTFFGDERWPFAACHQPPKCCRSELDLTGKRIGIVGLGSVGSEVARLLGSSGAHFLLVDGGTVSVFNPHRQWYGWCEIGQPKALALRQRLSSADAFVQTISAKTAAETADLLANSDLVVLATGTGEHGPLAEALYKRRIPHLVACAYPRARFFEVSVVLSDEGAPCLHCFRGHLYKGRESSPELSDEVARFLYQPRPTEEQDQLYRDLVAEPATAIDTGRIADLVAQTAVEMLKPANDRDCWFQRLVEDQTTCLIGGNVAEESDGIWAYGISEPGQIVRLGRSDVTGNSRQLLCTVCGQTLEVHHQQTLASIDEATIDEAFLT